MQKFPAFLKNGLIFPSPQSEVIKMIKNISDYSQKNKVKEALQMIKPVSLSRDEFVLLKHNWNMEAPIQRYYAVAKNSRYYFFPKSADNLSSDTVFSIIRLMDRLGRAWNRDRYGKYETFLYRNVITQVKYSKDVLFPEEAKEEIFQRMYIRMIAFAYRIKDINRWTDKEFRKLIGVKPSKTR